MIYLFDDSLKGLLSAVFDRYDRKDSSPELVSSAAYSPALFGETHTVFTEDAKAERVWRGLAQRSDRQAVQRFYYAFHTGHAAAMQQLFNYACYLFDHDAGRASDYGNKHVLAVTQYAQQVHREKHRMEAFIRFRKSNDGLYFAIVTPDFNVLPLIAKHFRDRYADQCWLIYDQQRKYGIHFDLQQVSEVLLDTACTTLPAAGNTTIEIDGQEELYTLLWQDYFKSANIKERKNLKLHLRHVPRRYWRYLTEKMIDLK